MLNDGKWGILGIHLTPLLDFCRMLGRGRLPANLGGVRNPIFDRGGLPGLLAATALAERFPVSAVSSNQGMALTV